MQGKKFKAIRYDRPDYAAYAQRIAKCASEISSARTIDELSHALEEFFVDRACVETMETLAFIRCYQDCTDKFYQEEMQYTQAQAAMMDIAPIYDALLESPYRGEIDARFGQQFLQKIEKERSLIKGGLELLGREQELIAQFQNMISAMRFSYGGQEISAAELSKYKESRDPVTRRNARNAYRKAFADRSDEFLNVLGELVGVRGQIAKANEYANYLEYANTEKGRYSYGEKELAQLCQLVRRELVPLKERLYEKLRNRLGLAAYTADDTGIYFVAGNPAPLGDAEFLLEQAGKMYGQMDEGFSALFEAMKTGGYFDCGKSADRGYPRHFKDVKSGACQIPGRDQRRTVKAVRVSHHCAVYRGYPEFYQYHERQHSGQTAGICHYGSGRRLQKTDAETYRLGGDLVFSADTGTVCYIRIRI